MKVSKTKEVTNREVKSSAFTAFFGEPKNAAKLYSALAGEEVTPEDIEYHTLEGVLYVARKNDMAFSVKNRILVISEHQSTINKNMPLRSIIYYGRTMEKMIEPSALYRRKEIWIPTPEFYVFYNGNENYPIEDVMKLSEVYLEKTAFPMLELIVQVININLPEGHALLEKCRPLYEYSWLIQRIRDYIEAGMNRDEAITLAIKDCLREGIMADFVREHGTEAVNMIFTQFDMDDALKYNYEEGVEDGVEIGKEIGKEIGELRKLVNQVFKKLAKGKCQEQIAEELEEEIEIIAEICAMAKIHGEDVEKICDVLGKEKNQSN